MSKRVLHTLTDGEAIVWEKLKAGPVAGRELGDAGAIRALADAKVVEVIEPLAEKNRPRILVIEPHSDDAALSIGGTMWRMRKEAEFHLLTLASRSNYTSSFQLHRNYFSRSQITQMRASEGNLFLAHLGGTYHCAGLSEATLRYEDSDWDLEFFRAHEVPVAIFNNRKADARILHGWVQYLTDFLKKNEFAEIWLPLGAGTHTDHDLARNAALQVLTETRPNATIRVYEDVPYGAQFHEHTRRILELLEEAGAELAPWQQDVTDVFPKKLALLSIFASQFKVGSIRADVERSADRARDGTRVEHLWTLNVLPRELPRDDLWIRAPDVVQACRQLDRLVVGASQAKRVAIFAIIASGRWPEDLKCLKGLFPSAKFVVYAGPRVSADFASVEDPVVKVSELSGSSTSWLKAALKEFGTSHRLVICGEARSKARTLRYLWPFGRTEIFSDMDHLVQAAARRAHHRP